MARYFFHVHCASATKLDLLGLELLCLEEALADAEEVRREIMLEDALDQLWFEVMDQNGHLVATVPVTYH